MCLAGFFLILLLIINNTSLISLDRVVTAFFTKHQTNFLFNIMYIISFFASTIFVGLFSLVFSISFYFKKRKKELYSYFATLLPAVVLGFIIKTEIQRVRPENLLESDYSFPSLHATAGMALYGWLAFYLWKQGKEKKALWLLLFPLLIGFSRIYLGVHWFSDVLGGWLLGGGWLLLIFALDKNVVPKK